MRREACGGFQERSDRLGLHQEDQEAAMWEMDVGKVGSRGPG